MYAAKILSAEIGCSLHEALVALGLRDQNLELAREYLQRKGIAVSVRGTPDDVERFFYPKWHAYKASKR